MLVEHIRFFACQFAGATDSFTSFAHSFFGRFFVMLTHFHLAVDPFTLHLFLQDAQSLIHVIITNDDFNHEQYPLPAILRSSIFT